MQDRLLGIFSQIADRGPLMLAVLLIIVVGTWGFIELADEVMEGETQTFDVWMIKALRQADDPATPIGPRWLHEAGRDLTALGGMVVTVGVTLAVCGYLLLVRKYHAIGLVLAATIGAMVLTWGLKQAFNRDRPDDVPHLSIAHSPSFPSGHAMIGSAVYLTLGVLLAQLVSQQSAKIYFLTLALLIAFLVGVSRIYMGVHYPTDVLAGWTAGLVWALLCWVVARYLQRRGAVEKPDEQNGNDTPAAKNVSGDV